MQSLSDKEFDQLISDCLSELPGRFTDNLKNVAILYEDEPSPQQRHELKLACNQTLFGLYEGVPLAARQGELRILPDKITLFKKSLLSASKNQAELKKLVKHTLWHEIAHYYGLDHTRIHALEDGSGQKP